MSLNYQLGRDMRKIPLHSKKYPGLYMLCDESDFNMLNQYSWCPVKDRDIYYAYARVQGKTKQAHRLILGITDSKIKVDHINNNGLDNEKANLRICSQSENGRNRGKTIKSTSGYKGVYWNKQNKNWRAQIMKDYKAIHLGCFNTPEEAYSVYCEAEKKLFGEFVHE